MMAPDPFKMTPRFEKIAFSRQDDPRPAKYQLYRKPLIEAGVELYEIKPTAGAQLKRRFREPAGSSIWWFACEDVYLRPPHWFHRLLQSRISLGYFTVIRQFYSG
jgi:hypothetical protein